MSKRPFVAGERVLVRDLDQTDGRKCSDKGTVIGISSDGVLVQCDHWHNQAQIGSAEAGNWYFPKQCRRLVRKKKPKPERADWAKALLNDEGEPFEIHLDQEYATRVARKHGYDTAWYKRLRPGEVIVDKEKLGEAWAKSFGAGNVFKDALPRLLEALGLTNKENER